MINVIDNFLEKDIYEPLYKKLSSNQFKEIPAGDKSFWVQFSTPEFDALVLNKISTLEGVKRKNIFSFFRVATDKVDTDWRIHSDAIINGERPERALVLYLSPSHMTGLHGTAFWEHKELGESLPEDVSFEDYDKVLLGDSNNIDKWDLRSVIGYRINRAVMYPCNYFHSKYPNEGWAEGRMVYVMFYK
jgi:hypothetical protein